MTERSLGGRSSVEDRPLVVPFGDAAVLITLSATASVESAALAQSVARRIRTAMGNRPGWGGVVPADSGKKPKQR